MNLPVNAIQTSVRISKSNYGKNGPDRRVCEHRLRAVWPCLKIKINGKKTHINRTQKKKKRSISFQYFYHIFCVKTNYHRFKLNNCNIKPLQWLTLNYFFVWWLIFYIGSILLPVFNIFGEKKLCHSVFVNWSGLIMYLLLPTIIKIVTTVSLRR